MRGLWVGSYTADSCGTGRGIELLRLDGEGMPSATLGAEAQSSSFLAAHPHLPVLYAAEETAGLVRAYRHRRSGALSALGAAVPAGEGVCHLEVDSAGRFLVASCYGDGRVVVIELDPAGALVERREGPGVRPGDRSSRAHAALVLPDGRVLSTDLGRDCVSVWQHGPGHGLRLQQEVALPEGSGPRHLARHSGGFVYVITETSNEVVVLEPGPERSFRAVGAVSLRPGHAAGEAAAHVSLDEMGRHLYATVRGSDRVVVLEVLEGGRRLSVIADVDCGVRWPRHHLQAGRWLFVAGQHCGTVAGLPLDETGIPLAPAWRVAVGSPSCLVPLVGRRPSQVSQMT